MQSSNKLEQYINHYQHPALIYDLDKLKTKMHYYANICRDTPIKMFFTAKSFPFKEVLELAYECMDGIEVSNVNEWQLLPNHMRNSIVSISDPTGQFNTVLPAELSKHNLCYINIDLVNKEQSFPFIDHPNVRYGARISHTSLIDCSQSPLKGNQYSVTESRFGTAMPTLVQLKNDIFSGKISGLHLHNGSDQNTLDDYLGIIDKICETLQKDKIQLSFLNLGGGLHRLKNSEFEQLVNNLSQRFSRQKMAIFFEPGECVARESGFALGKVMSIKKTAPKKYYVMLDLSNECHLKWSEPKLLNKDIVDSQSSDDNVLEVFIGGPTCFEQDCIGIFKVRAIDGKLPFETNEILTFGNINGYSAAWNISFNGIKKAVVLFI